MKAYEIPLTPEAQTFTISLVGKSYRLTIVWNAITACWILDIAKATGEPLIQGMPVVTGLDLFAQYGYLMFGGALVAQTDGSSNLEFQFDGNSTPAVVVDPGNWFVIGVSVIGGGDAIWGGSTQQAPSYSGPPMQSNVWPNDVPTFTNLGLAGRLFFVVP